MLVKLLYITSIHCTDLFVSFTGVNDETSSFINLEK